MKLKSSFFVFVARLILGIIIGNLILPPHLAWSQEKDVGRNIYQSREVHGSRFILGSKQIRRDYKLENGIEVLANEYDLSTIDVSVMAPSINSQNLHIEYNSERRELIFKRVYFDSKLERFIKTNEHILQDVEIDGAIKDLFLQDPNVTLFVGKNGTIYGSFTPVLMNSLFQAYIPFTPFFSTTLGNSEAFHSQSRISRLRFATPEVEPLDLRADKDISPVEYISVHDLIIEISHPDKVENILVSYYDDLMRRLRAHVMSLTLLLQTANPRDNLIEEMQEMLKREAKALTEADEKFLSSINGIMDESTNLTGEVLRNLSYRTDLETLSKLLSPDEKTQVDMFEGMANSRKYTWSAESWKEMFSQIQEARKSESEAASSVGISTEPIQNTWAQILLKQWKYPNLLTQEHLTTLAKTKTKGMQNFTDELFQFAKSQFTRSRLVLLGSVMSVDIANMSTDHAVNRFLFSSMDTILGWTQNVWMVKDLINETVKYADNLNAPFAYTSIVSVTCLLISIQPLSYLLAKSLSTIRGEKNPDGSKWSAAKAFFSYGGRFYAYVTYPFQLWIWSLLGQKNIHKAILSKRSVLSPGVLHLPHSSKSMEKGEEIMNQSIVRESQNRQRAMLLASVAVSEYLKNRSIKMDPSTLLMLIESVENGRAEKFYELLEKNELRGAWSEIAGSFYQELVKLHDENPEFSETQIQQVEKYVELLRVEVAKWDQKLEMKNGSLVACTTGKTAMGKACDFLRETFVKSKQMTSSLAMFVLTGGTSYLFFQKNKDFVAPEASVAIADPQYRHDFKGSMQISAATDTGRFPLALQFPDHAEKLFQLISDNIEQASIYGAQGGVEASMIQLIKRTLFNPSPNIGAMYSNRHVDQDHFSHIPSSEQEAYAGMKLNGVQSDFVNSAREMAHAFMDPEKGISNLAYTQIRRMDAVIQALQGKGAMGYFPRLFAMVMISLIIAAKSAEGLASFDVAEIRNAAGAALLKQANVIFNKMAVSFADGTFVLGYAVIWAPVIWIQNTLENKASANRALFDSLDHTFEQALRLQDKALLDKGVTKLQILYKEFRKSLPEKFSVPADQMSVETASEFFEYSISNPATFTLMNAWVSWANNFLLGSLVSTILYVGLSHAMYDPNVAILPQLTKSLTYFAATYLGATIVYKSAPKIVSGVKSLFQPRKKELDNSGFSDGACEDSFL